MLCRVEPEHEALGLGRARSLYAAAGRLDGYYDRGIMAWDVAAGVLIVEEAGGRVTDHRGRKLDMGGGEVVASNGALHPFVVTETGAEGR